VIQSEAYDGDKEQRKQSYPRHYQLKSPDEVQSDHNGVRLLPIAARRFIEADPSYKLGFGVRWGMPGRLIARAVSGGGVCERRLGGESAHFRAGRC